MGIFRRSSTESRAELQDSRQELERVSRGQREETGEYLAANDRVVVAEKAAKASRR
ncbi:hypothetical protein [Streptomyces sp. N35]|uniref:hypothetical protein n=1 Tax=Streptomyces sp. N35 TaxID=2795730 RepID=UPI0018F287C9|nr:hypothetical protein [Streptomyces sp. N35]